MATIHFQIANSGLFLETFFIFLGFPGNNLTPIRNCPGGARSVKLDAGV